MNLDQATLNKMVSMITPRFLCLVVCKVCILRSPVRTHNQPPLPKNEEDKKKEKKPQANKIKKKKEKKGQPKNNNNIIIIIHAIKK